MKMYHQFIEYKALTYKWAGKGIDQMDNLTGKFVGDGKGGLRPATLDDFMETQNVCAKLPMPLVQRMETACSILGISKRVLVEIAINEALEGIEEIFDQIDVHELQNAEYDDMKARESK